MRPEWISDQPFHDLLPYVRMLGDQTVLLCNPPGCPHAAFRGGLPSGPCGALDNSTAMRCRGARFTMR